MQMRYTGRRGQQINNISNRFPIVKVHREDTVDKMDKI